MLRALAAVLLLGTVSTAHAAEPYMWGVGPRLGTNFLPGAYPAAFPRIVTDDGFIDKVRTDVTFGFDSQYYIDGGSRLGLIGGFGSGSRFFDAHVLGKYNRVVQSAAVDFLFGGGAGFGTQRWGGDDLAVLKVPYFPVRLEVAGMIRQEFVAFQLTIYGQYNIQGKPNYVNNLGDSVTVRGGAYPTMGIELSVLFGDYEPPQPRTKR